MSVSSSVEALGTACPGCWTTLRATPCSVCGWDAPSQIEAVEETPKTQIDVTTEPAPPISFPEPSTVAVTGGDAEDEWIDPRTGSTERASHPISLPSGKLTRIATFTLFLVLTVSFSFWLIQPKPAASLLSVFSDVTPPLTRPEAIDEWAIKELYSGPPDEVDARIDTSREQLRNEWMRLQHRFDGSNHHWEHLAALANIAQALGAKDYVMLELSADLNTQIGVAKEIVGMREQSTSLALARKSFVRCAQMTTEQASIARLQRKVAELDALVHSY